MLTDGSGPTGGIGAPALVDAAPRDLCTDCGISRSSDPKRCGRACQFIQPDYPALERQVHGRPRDLRRMDELFFGPFRRMLRASLVAPRTGAQWTGIATRIGERLLETGAVDAVLAVAPDPADRWRPMPVIVTDAAGMAQCRGMRMGYAPLLALLEPARARLPASRDHRHPLPGLCVARARGRTRLRALVRGRHAVLRQHDDRQLPPVPRPAVRSARDDRVPRVPRRLSRRAAVQRRASRGDSVPEAADFAFATRFLPADLPHLCRLHQRARRT